VVLWDSPIGYTPPVGPAIRFEIAYNHRVDPQPQTPFFGGVGPMWEFNWLSYIEESVMISAPYAARIVHLRGEGVEWYHTYSPPTHWRSRAALVMVSSDPPRYERRLPDGSIEVFALGDRPASVPGRHVFLTEVIDPQGLTATLDYDASFRLVSITDAVGQVTTLEYLDPANPLAITRVTDPFGRAATLEYDSAGRLTVVTDVIGMASRFVYRESDFIAALTTPYGTTAFRREPAVGASRFVEATDPESGTERIEFVFDGPGPDAVASSEVPTGYETFNTFMDRYTSHYWDKRAMALYPGDRAQAVATSWNLASDSGYDHATSRNIPHSVKRPLESRVWYRYPNQTSHHATGVGITPTEVARVLDDGSTQLRAQGVNGQGMVTSTTDPLGRQTTYTYAANGIDRLETRQVTSGGTDLVASFGAYSAQHLPGTATDVAGQSTTTTYNAAGQPLTVTNAKSETTTFVYDMGGNGELQSVSGPVTGAMTTYTYDSFGRVRTVTDPDGYTVTSDYDALDRVTQRTYPDGTVETFTYERLELVEQRDRLSRVTRHLYDAMGRRTSTRDPAGRTVTQVWCACGSLDALIDANGHRTSWERDVLGRVTREVRADGTTDTHYTYDGVGRLKTVTDPKDQVTTYTYAADDTLLSTVYTSAVVPTPGVSYTYDAVYPRVTSMVDGIGTTSYTYHPAGTLGAGQVAAIDRPLTDDTITYAYDQVGRVTTRAINGAANTVTWVFDALGRVTSETNVLGAFAYTYDGPTSRVATVTYPNGQTSTYSYLPAIQDKRLQTIHHRYPTAATLSKFDYTYDAVGNILTWRQQADTTAVVWRYGYDAADQLTRAVKHATDTQETILQRFAYAYDPAGNRTVEQIDDAVTLSSYDALNRMTAQTPGGSIQIAGTLNEPGTVTISGAPAVARDANAFRGTVSTVVGTNTFTIVAQDVSGNQTTQQYAVDVAGTARIVAYDANGNLTTDGTRTFEWDAPRSARRG
jgi:YD repeat-containing protein